MSPAPSLSLVNEPLLADLIGRLRATAASTPAPLQAFEQYVRTAADVDLVRINALTLAGSLRQPPADVVALLLRARKIGLVTMEWQYVCPGCGEIVERLTSLTSATAHYYCQVCSADRDADLSSFIEVTFSVSPEVRRSRYHEPWSLSPEEHFFAFRFSQSAVVDDGTSLPEHLRKHALVTAYVEAGATARFRVQADPGYLWLTNGPALIVGQRRTDAVRSFEFEYTGVRSKGYRADIEAGPVEILFTNATERRYALLITMLPDHYGVTMRPFLSGAEVLSNQVFLDLFASETIVAGEGLSVTQLTLVFTDLQGSTALYERIGDMKAFDLVRQHFGYLRDSITGNSGALVKTIGDAVMASFIEPLDALRASLEMRERIQRFNAEAGAEQIALKIGLHSGACLAVTLNDRLDYFGQTVNIAARIQGLAGANEIVVSDDVLAAQGAKELVAGLTLEPMAVDLKGVAGQVPVHRIGAGQSVPRTS
jgi:class 3 adenylate cyclase